MPKSGKILSQAGSMKTHYGASTQIKKHSGATVCAIVTLGFPFFFPLAQYYVCEVYPSCLLCEFIHFVCDLQILKVLFKHMDDKEYICIYRNIHVYLSICICTCTYTPFYM